jgi:hypothetical protein
MSSDATTTNRWRVSSPLSQDLKPYMPVLEMLPANQEDLSDLSFLDSGTTGASRVLDWTKLNSEPASTSLPSLADIRKGATRLAVLVNTPRMLRAATVFAEQAGLQGVLVRVFVDVKEAQAWVHRGFPTAALAGR